jgi:hypothetical protein
MSWRCVPHAQRVTKITEGGRWLLAIGYWLLAVGCWLLAFALSLVAGSKENTSTNNLVLLQANGQ